MSNPMKRNYVTPLSREMNVPYKMMYVNSSEIDTTTYQRALDKNKVNRIAAEFDERIVNEPKLSIRDGKYYVFDGQHTIAARKIMNNNRDVDIVCKVYFDMSEEDEALLFAQQTGVSSKPTPGITLRAKKIGNDIETLAFIKVNEDLNIQPSYSNAHGKYRLRCINTARKEFVKIGDKQYREAMKTIVDAWGGKSASFISEVVVAMCRFVNTYFGEYDQKKFAKKLSYIDPYNIVKVMRTTGEDGGKKKALKMLLDVYNQENNKDPLCVKF